MHFSFLPRAVSKSNTTILQFKPLNQPGCCVGEFVTFFSPDSQDHALLVCWETLVVLFCLYPSALIPNSALVRHCPSTGNERMLFAAGSAASFICLSLWLHTRFKAVFPGVSWALVSSLPSTVHHLFPCHLSGASLPSLLAFSLASPY